MLRFIGWIVVLLNIGAAIFSLTHFLTTLQLDLIESLIINAAILSVAIFALGFFIKNNLLMTIAVPFLAAYGTLGLFTSSWSQGIPSEQAGNLLMTVGIIYVIYITIKKKSYVEFITGIAIGMFLLLPFNKFQLDYLKGNPEAVKKLGDPKFERQILGEPASQEAEVVQEETKQKAEEAEE